MSARVTAHVPTIWQTLRLLYEPGDVVELRVLGAPHKGTVSGYYSDMVALARDCAEWSGHGEGVYITLNRVKPDLLSRAANRAIEWAKHTTSDLDIVARRWWLIDLDPVRPSGISSTEREHQAALELARTMFRWLREVGVPALIVADSGNGIHFLIRVDLPNDAASLALLTRCLAALNLRFSDTAVAVDQKTANAARISKLYGTLAAKGDSTEARPHRIARLLSVPTSVTSCPREVLERLATMAPMPTVTPRAGGSAASFDIDAFLERQTGRLNVVGPRAWQGGRKWILNVCPWNAEHTNGAAFIVQFPSGAIAAGCHHNGCLDKDWAALRELIEPGSTTRRPRFSVEIL